MFTKYAAVILLALALVIAYPAATLAKGEAKKTTDTVTLEVDYDVDFEEVIKKCGFEWREKVVTAENFPTDSKGKTKLEFKMFRFTKHLSADEAIAEMEKLGFRPAQPMEFLTYVARDKTVGKDKPAVCLGRVWRNGRDTCDGQVLCTEAVTSPKLGWGIAPICRITTLAAGWPILAVRQPKDPGEI